MTQYNFLNFKVPAHRSLKIYHCAITKRSTMVGTVIAMSTNQVVAKVFWSLYQNLLKLFSST